MSAEQTPEQTAFWSALIGTCCGSAVFQRLRYNRWWRVLLHLVLISLLCGAGITAGIYSRIRPQIQLLEERFNQEFGGFELSKRGILPVKLPDTARVFALPLGGAIDYRPENVFGGGITEKEAQTLGFLFIWRPRLLITAVHLEEEWMLLERTPMAEFGQIQIVPASDLPEVLARQQTVGTHGNSELQLPPGEERIVISGTELMNVIRGNVLVSLLLLMFGMCLLLALLYTAIFTGMFRLTGGFVRLRNLTGGEFWKIGIYAGFPGMLVASCFPALDLPFLSYGSVFTCGLVFYWLAVVGRIEREKQEGGTGQNEKR